MKKILVTGGTGYIGSHTVVELINSGFEPVIIDNFSNSNAEMLSRLETLTGKSILFYEGDCCDEAFIESLFSNHQFSGVIHFAAFKAVGESVEQPLNYYDNNLGGLISILKAMEKFAVKKLVFSSSCTVYGNPENGSAVYETSALGVPNSPYGWTKLMGEQIIKDSCQNGKINAILLRYFNPIGAHPAGNIGELPQGKPNNIVPFITQTAIGIRDSLTVFGSDYPTTDGTCIRDYIHVVDIAKAHILSLDYSSSVNPEVFNLGTGKGTSVLELIRQFEEVSGKELNWNFGPRREGDVTEIYANTEKAEKQLGWKAQFTVKEALGHAWRWEQNRTAK
jgi:UDP-glucose 4-epimerase